MILDSSALIAVLWREDAAVELVAVIQSADARTVGAPTLVEAGLVLQSRAGPIGATLLSRFLGEASVTVSDFTAAHWPIAIQAFARYGRGQHRAGLNFGDCMTYAIAKLANEPLLFTGDDFSQTDIAAAGLGEPMTSLT